TGDGTDPTDRRHGRHDRADRAPHEGGAVDLLPDRRPAQRGAHRGRLAGQHRVQPACHRGVPRQEVRADGSAGIGEPMTTPSSDTTSAGAGELLRIEGLQSGYGPVTVLWDVNLVVRDGQITAL